MSRKRKLLLNTASSLIFQITTIICGFILPRLILHAFGSEVNGLVTSIGQFLSVISFLDLGVGSVVQSALYKPLAEKDVLLISQIITSAEKFFKNLARILLVYIVFLISAYPHIAKQDFGWFYTATLIGAIGINSFAQYYFGVVDRLLLSADQHGYIHYIAQICTLIANTIACAVLIYFDGTIHMVKLTTSLIYLVRPLALRLYVQKHYGIDRKAAYTREPIRQKWNGAAQHVAAVVLDGTDSIVLTIFASLSDVSIYSVYNLVLTGVKQLLVSMTGGVQSLMGEMLAKKEAEELYQLFGWTEWLIHTGAVLVFGCTSVLIVPFVRVYTEGIYDANYIQPLFAILITLAQAGHCLRLPYNLLILAGGHYRQTQRNYIAAAVGNIVISVVAVKFYGLIGVAIGTLAAMIYQTVWMAWYVSRSLINWPFKKFLSQCGVDIVTFLTAYLLSSRFTLGAITYWGWIILGIKVAGTWFVVVLAVNCAVRTQYIVKLLQSILMRVKK